MPLNIERAWFDQPPETPYRRFNWKDQYGTWFVQCGLSSGRELACGYMSMPGGQPPHPENIERQVIQDPWIEDSDDLTYTRDTGIDDPVLLELVRRLETGEYDHVDAGEDVPVPEPSPWDLDRVHGLHRVGGEPTPPPPRVLNAAALEAPAAAQAEQTAGGLRSRTR